MERICMRCGQPAPAGWSATWLWCPACLEGAAGRAAVAQQRAADARQRSARLRESSRALLARADVSLDRLGHVP